MSKAIIYKTYLKLYAYPHPCELEIWAVNPENNSIIYILEADTTDNLKSKYQFDEIEKDHFDLSSMYKRECIVGEQRGISTFINYL